MHNGKFVFLNTIIGFRYQNKNFTLDFWMFPNLIHMMKMKIKSSRSLVYPISSTQWLYIDVGTQPAGRKGEWRLWLALFLEVENG